ncbi:MAG: hypothetical protein KC933_02065 [Myxococcales bacterium]|nr:hypothetical protein [Myxococcales bacterium]MCB9647276.1 hypothetical protein [Deltaproteobacteria bacterium]
MSSLRVEGPVLPVSDVQVFRGTAQPWEMQAFRLEDLELRVSSAGEDRAVEVWRGAVVEGPVLVDANARAHAESRSLPVGSDVLASLPVEGTELIVGLPYESALPPSGYVLDNFAKGEITLDQRVVNTPRWIEETSFGAVVRLDTVAFNRLSGVKVGSEPVGPAETPLLRSFDMGLAYVGVTDLIHVKGRGWQVLRFHRLSPVEPTREPTSMDELAMQPHHEFTACAVSDDAVLAGAHDIGAEFAPFDACR